MPPIVVKINREVRKKRRCSCCKHKHKKHKNSHKRKKCRCTYEKKIYRIRVAVQPDRTPPMRVQPIVRRYFYFAPRDIPLSEEPVLAAGAFVDDTGAPVCGFPDRGQEGYYNVFVNGVMQQGGMYRIRPESLAFAAADQSIPEGASIIIESIEFIAEPI